MKVIFVSVNIEKNIIFISKKNIKKDKEIWRKLKYLTLPFAMGRRERE